MLISYTIRYWWNNISETTFGRVILGKANLLFCNLFADPAMVCQGTTSQLHAQAFGGSGNYTYEWTSDPPGFISTLQDPVVAPLVSTVYTVVVSDGNDSVSQSISLEVKAAPNLPFDPEIRVCVYDSVTLDAGNEGSEYLWSDGSVEKIRKVGATGVGFEIQMREVTITSPEGCTRTFPCAVVFDFSNCTSISEQDEGVGFQLYPNPVAGVCFIRYCLPVDSRQSIVDSHVRLKIYDLQGREMVTLVDGPKPAGEFAVQFDASSLPAGVYLLKLQAGGQSVVRKLFVQW